MKMMMLLLVLVSSMPGQDLQLKEIRSLYKQAAVEEAAAKKLLKHTEDAKDGEAIKHGYHGVANMMMAKFVGNPFRKLSYFKKGKEFFSEAIAREPQNLELRFLRFTVQAETPGFLNYKQDLEEDKEMLLSRVLKEKDNELKQMIMNYLITSNELTAVEKETLK